MRVELMNEVNQIRKRAYLLPRHAMIHHLPISKYGEHTYAAYNEENYPRPAEDLDEFWDSSTKRISNFWKIPDFWEIYTLQYDNLDFKTRPLFRYELNVEVSGSIYDKDQKSLIRASLPLLSTLDLQNAELTI